MFQENALLTLFEGDHPRLVMFDLDGTLVDSVPDIACAVDKALSDLSYDTAGEKRVRAWVGNGAAKLVERAIAYAETNEQQKREMFNSGLFDTVFKRFMKHYSEHTSALSVCYEGVEPFLRYLNQQQCPMACVTNKPKVLADKLLQALELDGYFDVVLGGDCLPVKKPDPAPLLHVLDRMGVSQKMGLMVGDSKNDVLAAQSAGCKVVCVRYGYNHGESVEHLNAHLLVDSLVELI